MNVSTYKSGGTVGGKWGCALAAFVGVPIFSVLLIADALGDCAPDVPCRKGFWTYVALPSSAIALAVGLAVRWLVNRWRRNDC